MDLRPRNAREREMRDGIHSMRSTVERVRKCDLASFRAFWCDVWKLSGWDKGAIADTDHGYYLVDLQGYTAPEYLGRTAKEAWGALAYEYTELIAA